MSAVTRERFLVLVGIALICVGFYYGAQTVYSPGGSWCGTAFDSDQVLVFGDRETACDGVATGPRLLAWALMLAGAALLAYRIWLGLPSRSARPEATHE